MADSLRKIRLISFIFILLEAVALGILITFYFIEWPSGIQDVLTNEIWMIIAGGVFVVDMIFIFIAEIRLSFIRQKADLEAAKVIGSDVQEAYAFGEIGLIVTTKSDIIMWVNSFLKERHNDILDKNIFEFSPQLADLKSKPADSIEQIEKDGKDYQVKYLAEANLWIFRDCTEFQRLSDYSKSQATVIGVIMIDNFKDVAGNTEDDNNDTIAKVRAVIFDYAKEFGVLLRRYRNDSYFAVCNYASLERMELDGFSILEKVRYIGRGQNVIPTLSCGFAHGNDDVGKLNDMAANAIDISMSRGGDQVVVSRFGTDLQFFGGRSAAVENTSRVQFRNVADSLMGLIRASTNVIVSGHLDMDMDALGSCLGVMAICNHIGKPCQIVYDPKLTEKKTRNAFQTAFSRAELEKMTITPKDAEEKIMPDTLMVVVDVSNPSLVMGGKALDKSSKTVVLDHHRRGEDFISHPVLSYIDPSAGSASEILAEFIHYATANPRVDLPSSYATIMLSGMFLDTTFFKSKSTGARSFEAAEILKEFGADNQRADDYLKDDYEEYALVTEIVSTVKTPYTGIVYCVASENYTVERATLSKVANQLMQLKGINACFVIGRTGEKEVRISCRSDGSVNVQILAEKLGGGGHYAMAAASFNNLTTEVVEERLLDCLDSYLNEARSDLGGKH